MKRRLVGFRSTGLIVGVALPAGLLATALGTARAREGAPLTTAPPASGPGQANRPAATPAQSIEVPTIEVIETPRVVGGSLDPQDYPRIERAVNLMNARATRAAW
jgi:hypothetical protein